MPEDFIAEYPHQLPVEFCMHCIDKFEADPAIHPGRTGFGVDPQKKHSTDLTLDSHLDRWQGEIVTVQQAVLDGLVKYVRRYPHLLAGAVALQHQGADGRVRPLEYADIQAMPEAALKQLITQVYRLGSINLQRYRAGQGGYFHWHSEHFPHPADPQQLSLHRVLLWMFYLNDVESGGETEFFYQKKRVKPVQGTMVIAPAGFTHTHRGNTPRSNDKYILTSWLLFQDAARLYGH